MRSEPVMIGLPKTEEDAGDDPAHRPQHREHLRHPGVARRQGGAASARTSSRAASTTGALHRDQRARDRAVRAGLVRRAHQGQGPLKPDQPSPAVIEVVYRGHAGRRGGLKPGDIITAVDGTPTPTGRRSPQIISRAGPRQPGDGHGQARRGRRGPSSITVPEPDISIFVAGEPRLYGWVYNYAGDVFWIFTAHLVLRVDAALDVLPRLARRAPADASPASSPRSGASASST